MTSRTLNRLRNQRIKRFGNLVRIFPLKIRAVGGFFGVSLGKYLPRTSSFFRFSILRQGTKTSSPSRLASFRSASFKSRRIHSTTSPDCLNESRARSSLACSRSGYTAKNSRYPEREPEWTIIRTPFSTQGRLHGRYSAAPRPGWAMSRERTFTGHKKPTHLSPSRIGVESPERNPRAAEVSSRSSPGADGVVVWVE